MGLAITVNKLDGGVLFNCWGEFSSTTYENNFQAFRWRLNARRLGIVCLLSAIAYLSGVIVDMFDNSMLPTPEFWIMASCRLLVFAAGISLGLVVMNRKDFWDYSSMFAAYMILIGFSCIS